MYALGLLGIHIRQCCHACITTITCIQSRILVQYTKCRCVDVRCICQMFMGRSLAIKYLGWWELVWLQCWGTSGQFCQGLSRSGWSASVTNYTINVSFKAQHYRTNNIIMTMGEDFQYENANTWYKNLDKLMYYVNKVWNVHGIYTAPRGLCSCSLPQGFLGCLSTSLCLVCPI